ncbi:MAG: ORF6N domain-containing protein [Bacteroidota bacterium]
MEKVAQTNALVIPDEVLMNKIYLIRGQKVMIDNDLSELYGVETRRLNEQVKRNISRFPEDFMFQLSVDEFINLKSQIATSSWGGRRKLPYVFTEHGVLMLSSVLNTERAIKVNIQVMRIYVRLREIMMLHDEFLQRLESIERKLNGHDNQIMVIFEYLKQFEQTKQQELEQKDRPKIGYKPSKAERLKVIGYQ